MPALIDTDAMEAAMQALNNFRTDAHLNAIYRGQLEAERVELGRQRAWEEVRVGLENARAELEHALAEKERERGEKERERGEKERERGEKELALAEKEREREEKEAALAELALLRASIGRNHR